MDERFIIMVKDFRTGLLEKELMTFDNKHSEQLCGVFAYEVGGKYFICMELTTGKEISDEHFDLVYDHYNEENFAGLTDEFFEIEDCENPSWEVTIPFVDGEAQMQKVLQEVMDRHVCELERVYKLLEQNGD